MDYNNYILTYIKKFMDKNYDYVYLKSQFEKGIGQILPIVPCIRRIYIMILNVQEKY